MGENRTEPVDVEKCRNLANLAEIHLLNHSSKDVAEITNLDYHESAEIINIVVNELCSSKHQYTCEKIPIINGNNCEESYKLIIRGQI